MQKRLLDTIAGGEAIIKGCIDCTYPTKDYVCGHPGYPKLASGVEVKLYYLGENKFPGLCPLEVEHDRS
jgi:hypothetical protein